MGVGGFRRMSFDSSPDREGLDFVVLDVSVHVELDPDGSYRLHVRSLWVSRFNEVTEYRDEIRFSPDELDSPESLTL